MSSTLVTPAPPSRWERFATFVAGRSGRFFIVLITASLVAADLVAVGPSWVAGATVIAVTVLYVPLITRNIHERALAALIGALLALYLIMGLEIYLGATGFRYGPIGAIGRGSLGGVDQGIIWFLNCFYQNGGWFKSGFGPIVFVVAYFIVFGILSATHANRLNNIWTAVCGFIVVVLMFPFAHGFDGKQVAFTRATLSVSSSLKTLGSYEPAKQEAIKDNNKLRGFLAELNDPNHQKEREALEQAIRTYAQLLLKLDDEGRARTQILYQPNDAYVASQFLSLPPVTYPPRDEPEVKAAEADPYEGVSVTSVAHAEELLRKRDSLVDEVARLRHERDTALTEIKIFVGNEVNATLGEQRRTEVADDARSAIVQMVALHNLADATRALEAKNTELRNKIASQEQENGTLRDAVARYRRFRLDYLRRDADCAQLRQNVLAWLKQSPSIIGGLSGQWEKARAALRRDRPFVDTLDPPRGLDAERFDKNITDELSSDGHWPPAYTEAKLETELITLNETTGGALSTFIEASCRAGHSEAEIKDRLTRMASELSSPTPKPDLR